MTDLSVQKFCQILRLLKATPKATKELDIWGTAYFKNQKDHVIGFLSWHRGTTAKTCYNRLLNPGMLVWIADALGEEPERIRAAADAAFEAGKIDYRKRCSAFRRIIPFDRICELIENPKGWRRS